MLSNRSVSGSGQLVAGRYRLLDQLGRGAMGIVWRGHDELLDREVAVKQIILPPAASDADAAGIYQRTLREARTAARLSHPGVVTVFDVVEENGMPWIVMELIRARPLDQVIAEDGPLPPAQAAQLGLSLLDALATAHAAGVLHRDVKPSNVLISPAGKAILTDFGIATIQGDPGMTQAGMVVGTPGFSPPERVRGAPASTASDLWSLGATLYAAVEGRGPFDRAGGSMAIVASIATEPAPKAPSAGPLGPVIDALLRADPAQRPDASVTARMLTDALAQAGPADGRGGSRLAAAQAVSPAIPDATTATSFVGVWMASSGTALGGADDQADGAAPGAGQAAQAGLEAAGLGAAGLAAAAGYGAAAAGAAGAGVVGAAGAAASLAVAEPDAGGGAGAATSVVPDLMATPVFAELRMPVQGGPASPASPAGSGGSGDTASAGTGPQDDGGLASAATGPGAAVPLPPGPGPDAAGDSSRPRRGLVIWSAVAVSVIVIGVVFLAFPSVGDTLGLSKLHTGSAVGTGSTPSTGIGGRTGSSQGAGSHHHGRSSAQPTPGGSHGHSPQPTPTSGKHGSATPTPSGKPSHSGKPSPSGSPSTTPSQSATPSPSPSPSPSRTAATLPPGYIWQSESAATAGSTAGFQLATPGTWLMTTGLDTVFQPPAGAARLGVNMNSFKFPAPVRQAKFLQRRAIALHTYPNYHLVSILAGPFHGSAAATWTFWYRPPKALHRIDVVALLFTAKGAGWSQSYVLSMGAPAPKAAWASHVMRVAMRTFSPLPG